MSEWGSPVEQERRRRILVSLWAYAYEFESESLVDDATFDFAAATIDPTVDTGNEVLDRFFQDEFDPHTGMWVRKHPDLPGMERLYGRMKCLGL